MKVTKSQLARELGLSRARVTQLVTAGNLTVDDHGKLDLETAKAQYLAYQQDGGNAPAAETDKLNELLQLKLELTQAKLEQQRAQTALAKLKAKIQAGKLVSFPASCALHSRITWRLYQSLDTSPLSFLHLLTDDRDRILRADQIYRDDLRRAFKLAANESAISKENAYVIARAEMLIELAKAQKTIAEHEGRATEHYEICQEFAEYIKGLFCEMDPAVVKKLGMTISHPGMDD